LGKKTSDQGQVPRKKLLVTEKTTGNKQRATCDRRSSAKSRPVQMTDRSRKSVGSIEGRQAFHFQDDLGHGSHLLL
jgi:hypothetical protein